MGYYTGGGGYGIMFPSAILSKLHYRAGYSQSLPAHTRFLHATESLFPISRPGGYWLMDNIATDVWVPEPASLLVLAVGFTGILARRMRR